MVQLMKYLKGFGEVKDAIHSSYICDNDIYCVVTSSLIARIRMNNTDAPKRQFSLVNISFHTTATYLFFVTSDKEIFISSIEFSTYT